MNLIDQEDLTSIAKATTDPRMTVIETEIGTETVARRDPETGTEIVIAIVHVIGPVIATETPTRSDLTSELKHERTHQRAPADLALLLLRKRKVHKCQLL